MFYDQLIVDIPQKKRIKAQGNCFYVYEILSRKTKTQVEKVVTVGKAIDDKTMHPNEKYFDLHPDSIDSKPLPEPSVFDSRLSVGEYMVVNSLFNSLGLKSTIIETFGVKNEPIIQALLCYILDRQNNSNQLATHYLFDHYCGMNYIPTLNQLSHLYNNVFIPEAIAKFITNYFTQYLNNHKDSIIDINYDSTNYNTASKNISSAEYGKAKNDEGLPQFNVSYLVDRINGYPMYYDFYYGSIIDNSHCKVLIDKIKSIRPKTKTSFIMDRGYFSRSNLEYFIENNYHFSCMGKDGVVLNKLIKEYPIGVINKPVNRIQNSIYGIKEKGKPFEEFSQEVFLYLFFDPSKNQAILETEQNHINYICSKLKGKSDKDGNIQNTYGKIINLTIKRHIIIEAKPNYEYLDTLQATSGYFFIVSNEDLTNEEILEEYRMRDVIEKDFSYSKSGAGMKRTFATNDITAESRTFIGFLASVIRSALINTLKPYFKQYSQETSNTVLAELNKIKIQKYNGQYVLDCALTNRQKQILSFFNMNQKSVYDLIKEKNAIPEQD